MSSQLKIRASGHPSAEPSAERADETSGRTGRVRRPVAVTLLLVAVVTAVVAGPGASSAGAYITISGDPGTTYTEVECASGRLMIMPSASVMRNATNGQYVAYRYHLTASNGYRGTSGWSGSTLVPFRSSLYGAPVLYPRWPLTAATPSVARGLTWTVQVQYAWLTSSGWVYSGWTGPTEGYRRPGSTFRWWTACQT
jgi:hypothetical protein